jgi:hypothetical protein
MNPSIFGFTSPTMSYAVVPHADRHAAAAKKTASEMHAPHGNGTPRQSAVQARVRPTQLAGGISPDSPSL